MPLPVWMGHVCLATLTSLHQLVGGEGMASRGPERQLMNVGRPAVQKKEEGGVNVGGGYDVAMPQIQQSQGQSPQEQTQLSWRGIIWLSVMGNFNS